MKIKGTARILSALTLSMAILVGCTATPTATTAGSKAEDTKGTTVAAESKPETKEYTWLTTDEVVGLAGKEDHVFVDVRHDSFYNGFKEAGAKRGGHIKGAVQYTSSWIGKVNEAKLEKFVGDKGIDKSKKIVVYGSDKAEVTPVADMLKGLGYKDVLVYDKMTEYAGIDSALMSSFPRFSQLVDPVWLNDAINKKSPETLTNQDIIVYEVSWGPEDQAKDYLAEHIPGAGHFNTDWIEEGPVWNLSAPEVIRTNLEKAGINEKKTVILYSADASAAGRVFFTLKAVGVEDVRILNGGLAAWKEKGFETTKDIPKFEPAKFSGPIALNKDMDIATSKEAMEKQKEGLKLVSIRSWEEYDGKTSGYDYIPKKGEPKGAIWGFAGSDASSMQDYYDPDGTFRNPLEIVSLWNGLGINQGEPVAFYCGTGWRATIPWEMTQMLGWDKAVLFDGGWNEWQMDPSLPIQEGAPNGMKQPDSKNDFN